MPQNSNEKHQLCMTILNSQEGQTVERESRREGMSRREGLSRKGNEQEGGGVVVSVRSVLGCTINMKISSMQGHQ